MTTREVSHPERSRSGGRQTTREPATELASAADLYFNAISRVPLLSAAEEVELSKRIEAGLYAEHKLLTAPATAGDGREGGGDGGRDSATPEELSALAADGHAAKRQMLEANLRLVVSIAKRYSRSEVPFLDLVQEGNLGLLRAVDKFDYAKGYKFSTYATWWIRQAIQRGIAESERTVRLPVHVHEQLSKIRSVSRRMREASDHDPTPQELADELGIGVERVRHLLRVARGTVSLDTPVGESDETVLGDLLEDQASPAVEASVEQQDLASEIRREISVLDPRQANVISLRYGLTDGHNRGYAEIGKRLGLSAERVRQLEKRALATLRDSGRAEALAEYAA